MICECGLKDKIEKRAIELEALIKKYENAGSTLDLNAYDTVRILRELLDSLIHWQPCEKCGIKNYNLHEWYGERICYSCMKKMGLIGL